MKKIMIRILVLFLALLPKISNAGVTVLGGLNYANPSITTTSSLVSLTTSSNAAFGLGVLISKEFSPLIEVETGLLYLNEKFTTTTTTIASGSVSTMVFNSKRIHLPVMVRFTALPFLSAGVGVFYENGIGDLDLVTDGVASSSAFNSAGINKSDYGLDFDLRLKWPVLPKIDFVADLRSQWGVRERFMDSSQRTYFAKSIQALAGVNLNW